MRERAIPVERMRFFMAMNIGENLAWFNPDLWNWEGNFLRKTGNELFKIIGKRGGLPKASGKKAIWTKGDLGR